MTSDRLGVQPLGFSTAIILLTGVHFHFAGFGLLAIASLLAAQRPALRIAVLGLIIGIPITAAGFILASDPLGALGAAVVGLSGIGVAIVMLRGHARSRLTRYIRRLAGVALLVGMPMAIAWSAAIVLGLRFLDLELMVRTHGALNAGAVLVLALTYGRAES